MRHSGLILLLFITSVIEAQLPDTDIWLMDIKDSSGVLRISNPVNITNRPGYDNQPSFSPDGSCLLYTSIREKQSDIYKYHIKKKKITQLTSTDESEYSPMVTPDGKSISVVRVEKDSTQRIWKFPVNGGNEFSLVMDKIDSVGYYSWYSKDSIAIFVLTEPFSLQLVNVHRQAPRIIALNVGRCFRWVPDGRLFYFQNNALGTDKSRIFLYFDKKTESGAVDIMNPLSVTEDYAIYYHPEKKSSGELTFGHSVSFIMGKANELYISRGLDWMNMGSLDRTYKITRIAISPDQKKLAVVVTKL